MINVAVKRAMVAWTAIIVTAYDIAAVQREVQLPTTNGDFAARPSELAFARDGQLGFALVSNSNGSMTTLFSFSVSEGQIVDQIDLSQDFGTKGPAPFRTTSLKVHNETGGVLVHGCDSTGSQKVIALATSQRGELSKLWSAFYSGTSFIPPEVTFNKDGSRVFVVYRNSATQDSSPSEMISIALIRTDDGVTLAQTTLPEGAGTSSILFDAAHNRAVGVIGGIVYLFGTGSDRLEIESVSAVIPQLFSTGALSISRDGRFLIAYGGYIESGNISSDLGANVFYTYDLELKALHTLSLAGHLIPSTESLGFHRPTGALLVPYSVIRRKESDGSYSLSFEGTRQSDIITLAPDGLLRKTAGVKLAKESPGTPAPNRIRTFNNIVLSATGALGFIPSSNGRLFTFDTSTGEIVDDKLIDPKQLFFIQLVEPAGRLAFSNGGKLFLTEVSTGPVLDSIDVKSRRSIIKGANFLVGTHVEIDGVDVGEAKRNPDDPGHEIIIERGRKKLPHGRDITVTVVNRDGLRSRPLIFRLQDASLLNK